MCIIIPFTMLYAAAEKREDKNDCGKLNKKHLQTQVMFSLASMCAYIEAHDYIITVILLLSPC